MAGVSRNPDRGGLEDLQGFLNNMQDWDHMLTEKGRNPKRQAREGKKPVSARNAGNILEGKGPREGVPDTEAKKRAQSTAEVYSKGHVEKYNFLRYSDAASQISSRIFSDEEVPDAASEKELGNEYFKQKKFIEAIECYSRSIGLSPSAVAFANRAMAYLRVKRFEEAENDCSDALHLDDRYVKAYCRRATARKELGKLKESMEDCEFGVSLEPNNQELMKQYTEMKALHEKETAKKASGASKNSMQKFTKASISEMALTDSRNFLSGSSNVQKASAAAVQTREVKHRDINHKKETKEAIQELASRAASRVTIMAAKNITAPRSAYEFEVSWRALSDDRRLQANLLKATPPATLPGIFKNALSASLLVDMVKCTATFLNEDTDLAVNILDNLSKVPRFDVLIMCLSPLDRADLNRIWNEAFSCQDFHPDHLEALHRLRLKYCSGR